MEGTYRSLFFDAGRTTAFGTARWTADVPAGTSLRFQAAVSSTASGPWLYVGRHGTVGSYSMSSGTSFKTPPTGRYVCCRATFASDTVRQALPTHSVFNLSLGRASIRVVRYTYDSAGNLTRGTDMNRVVTTFIVVRKR